MDPIARRWLLFLFTVIALAGAVVAALATTQQRDEQLRGYVDATQTLDLPYRVPRLGVNADLTQYSPDELEIQLQSMRQAGIYWIRQTFPWDAIEPASGEFQWAAWDQLVDAVDRHEDLELVAVLVNTPAWARIQPDAGPTAPPAETTDFANFAGAFATRYGDSIHYYQIWDEPNIRLGWGQLYPDVTRYAGLLQAAYETIHQADDSATVIAAALAPTIETGPQNISELVFLDDLYRLGVSDFADAFAGKPYGFDLPPDDRVVSPDRLNFSRIIALREIMERHGDSHKALWASAWGWNSLPPDWQGEPSTWGDVTQESQIQFTMAALERTDREWPWLGGMILTHWQPAVDSDNPRWGFAVINRQGQPGALWQALADHAQSVAPAATNGHYPTQNVFARYSGIWSFSGLGAGPGWVNDSRAQFTFMGTDVALIVRQDDSVSTFYISVNNQPANALPLEPAGNAFLLLRSADLRPAISVVPVARDLATNTVHTLQITTDKLIPDEPAQRWPLVGYAVSPGDLAAPYNRQIIIAWGTVFIAAMSAVATARSLPWQTYIRPVARYWRALTGIGQIIISAITSLALLAGLMLTYSDGVPALFRRDPINLLLSVATAGFIYWNNFGPILIFVACLALFIMIYNRLELGVLLSVFFAPFFLFPVELYQFAFPMVEILILLTGAAWLLRLFADWGQTRQAYVSHLADSPFRRVLSHLSVMDYLVIGWVVLGLISLSWTQYRTVAITELRTLIIEPALLYGVLRYAVRDQPAALRVIGALSIAGVAVAVVGLFMFLRGEQIIIAEAGAQRLASVYGSPNNVGLFLGRCLPFATAFMLMTSDRRMRVLWAGAVFVMLFAIALSQSAGAIFLGVPAALALVLVLVWRRRAWIPLAGMAIILIFGLVFALQMPRFARALDFDQGTNFYRVRVWQSTINVIEDHPITGLGLDQFLYAFRGTYIMPDAWEEPNLSHPHNILLDQWVRLGIAGVGLLVAMQIVFWRRTFKYYQQIIHHRSQQNRLMLVLVVGIMASMFNLLVHGMVDHSIYVTDLAVVFALLLGLAVNLPEVGAAGDSR